MFDNIRKPKSIKITFRVTESEHAALRHACEIDGRSPSNAMRRAARLYVDEIDATYAESNSSGTAKSNTDTESP